MKTDISIKMKGGISGILTYKSDIASLEITVENTGDYSRGILVFVNEINEQLTSSDSNQIKSQVLRDLQQWSKQSGQKLCW
jgi:hypothetical protein